MRPEFEQALRVFAAVSDAIDKAGFLPPILVGGAAVELYTGSIIATGDFDVVTTRQDIFEKVLREHGFIRPSGIGKLLRGWIHPRLGLGFEVVGSDLLEGHADRERVKIFEVKEGNQFSVIAVEDLIADRMGQFASGTAPEMLQQAKTLFALSKDLDCHYMEQRIREETDNQYGVSELQSS